MGYTNSSSNLRSPKPQPKPKQASSILQEGQPIKFIAKSSLTTQEYAAIAKSLHQIMKPD